jgi:hypothetical protein
MKNKVFMIVEIGLLLIASMVCGKLQSASMIANGSSYEANIDVNAEYSNGSISSPYEGLALWYTWLNTSSTQVIFLAYHSYVVNPPIIEFLGQHYYNENNTEVFIGNTLTSMEIYNDTNRNGLPDADYVSGTSEILYYFQVNSSKTFEIKPVEKILVDGLSHYTWSIRYNTIDGFLTCENQSTNAIVIVEYMDFSYDFHIQDNVSYLKTNFGIGKILEIRPFYNATVSLDGLSLALCYGTAVITSKPYVTMVNGNPYNSTTAPASVEPTDLSEIKIEDTTAYKFMFGQDYTLFRDSQQETHESQSTAVSNKSVSDGLRRSLEWVFSNLETVLTSLFPKISNMQTAIDLDYNVSSFLYRVCYPEWDGYGLEHDPTYVAYLSSAILTEISPPLQLVIIATILCLVALTIALYDFKKTRRMLSSSVQNQPKTFFH